MKDKTPRVGRPRRDRPTPTRDAGAFVYILQDLLWDVYEGRLRPGDKPLTQGELGELLGCAQQTAASYLGGTPIPPEAIETLCINLGMLPIELLLEHPRCRLEAPRRRRLTRKQKLLEHLGEMYSIEELTRIVLLHQQLDADDFDTAIGVLELFAKRKHAGR